ncbi:hypothetical protein Tco_0359099 [Tanacetum coccineum]
MAFDWWRLLVPMMELELIIGDSKIALKFRSPTRVKFLRWLDLPMCQRSVQIIPVLLRSRNELEEILAMIEENRRKVDEISHHQLGCVMGYDVMGECGFELIDGMISIGNKSSSRVNTAKVNTADGQSC